MANFLPGLLALAIVLLFSMLMAWVVSVMVKRSLRGFDFDQRLSRWGFSTMAEWSPAKSPTLLMARLAYWIIMLIGLLIGVSALDASLTTALALRLFAYLPNLVAALMILVVGTILARFLARGVLISAVNMQIQSARLLSLGVKWLILVMTGAMALEHLGIGGEIVRLSFGILFGGIVLALALAVGLGSKDIVSRSWERQIERTEEEAQEHWNHL